MKSEQWIRDKIKEEEEYLTMPPPKQPDWFTNIMIKTYKEILDDS